MDDAKAEEAEEAGSGDQVDVTVGNDAGKGGWAIRSQYGIDHMNSPENWEVTGGFVQCKNHSLGVITKARALVS